MHWIVSIYRVSLAVRTQEIPSVHALRVESIPRRYAPSHRYRIVAGPEVSMVRYLEQLSIEKGLAQGEKAP